MNGQAGIQTILSDCAMEAQQSGPPIGDEEIEGVVPGGTVLPPSSVATRLRAVVQVRKRPGCAPQ